jgi:hypothetical protein
MVSDSPLGTPASSTTKTGRHDIAEILQKVALDTIKQNQILRNSCFEKNEHYYITFFLILQPIINYTLYLRKKQSLDIPMD